MTDMIRVSSTEFGKELGRYQDAALSQPVIVTRNGRDRTVMIRHRTSDTPGVYNAGSYLAFLIEPKRMTVLIHSIHRFYPL